MTWASSLLYGMSPVVIAVIAGAMVAVWALRRLDPSLFDALRPQRLAEEADRHVQAEWLADDGVQAQ